ncbi:hypothetical protein M409DRAFT_17642 [Zasmidium cellare ATCC 36951]|uniref:SMP domain-containing protein n=1 Tax=Zasmidium cellare ATCC 36951 TaxID=1080233 RepID=A0A6A6D2R9_ZASCE|nr:uncharacterized protein M409DRAFT_17642 [Zasmidium cellare ATCC 36951]KAF2172409.1 hypothetical protein M409DRAFT_17642 [Zasmidium cellare ATCC 36951]
MPIIPGDKDPEIKNNLAEGAKGAEQAKAERTGGVASTEHHKANPGPVIAENLPEAASKEELKKRAEELNKK